MTDISAQPRVGPGRRYPKADASMAAKRQVAIRAIDLKLELRHRYLCHLDERIAKNAVRHLDDAKTLKCHLGRLAEPDAIDILAVIWRNCSAKRKLAGVSRKVGANGRITRHALGKALEASSRQPASEESWPKFLRRASRIVEAGITYGLIVEEKDQAACAPGCKPLHGTKRLDEFMTVVGFDFAVLLRRTFLYSGKKFCKAIGTKKPKGGSKA